ncbi:ATP-binding protein [Nibricoccus sp. IMCC34717]|uniref:ATP-binding protein n=1 Tax=Nibricoccus sp. IMCC34717 TaxID=3034021 RepID=UPI00384E83CA
MIPLPRLWLVAVFASTLALQAGWEDREAGRVAPTTYGPAETNATGFNWCVVTDHRGRLYVGNDQVLEFDGRRWRTLEINGANSVRALAVDDANRLWVAATEEIGWFDEAPTGERVYHSLRALVPPPHRLGETWGVHVVGGTVHFVTANAVLSWDGKRFTVREFPARRRIFSFVVDGALHVSQPDFGLWRLAPEGWVPLLLDGLEREQVGWAVSVSPDVTLFGAQSDIVRREGTTLKRCQSPAAEWLRKAAPVTAQRLGPGVNAIATFFGGLLLLDDQGVPIRALSRDSGLPSQSLTGLHVADDGSFWVAATHALFRLEAKGAASVFTTENGLDVGIARTFFRDAHERIFATAEEGVARLDPAADWRATARFKRFPELEGLFWSAVAPAGEPPLLAGTKGLVEWTGERARRLRLTPLDIFQVVGNREQLFGIEGNAVVHYVHRDGTYPEVRRLIEFTEPATSIGLDADGALWVSTPRSGLLSFANPAEENPPMRDFRLGDDLPSDFRRAELFRIGGRLFASTAGLVFEAGGGKLRPVVWPRQLPLQQVEIEGGDDAWGLCAPPDQPLQLVRLTAAPEGLRADFHPFPELQAVGRPVLLQRAGDHRVLWVSGTSGILKVDTTLLSAAPAPAAPSLLAARWTARGVSEALPLTTPHTLSFAADSSLTLDFRNPASPIDAGVALEYRLGNGAWTPARAPLVFNGLHEGSHDLQVRLRGGGPSSSYPFVIRPPWHRSVWAWAAYVATLACLLWWIVSWRLRRIARLNTELQRLVDQRTEELTRATAAKSAFLANMGHEILNPLNGVVGLVDQLQRRNLHTEEREIAGQLDTCARQVVSVVEDVLEYARLEAGRVNLRLQTFAVAEPIAAAVGIFRAVQQKDACPIHIEVPENLKHLVRVGAPDRIRQVLVNYLSNALKFSEGTPVTVSLVAQGGDQFIYAVRDEGPGIPLAEQSQLFHRFSRTSAARRSDIPGTGLGLAACKGYAEVMGGEVWLSSKPGEGATFYLRVPLRKADEVETPATVVNTEALRNLRVLVVDDHELNRSLFIDTLGRLGAQARSAASVSEARQLFLEHKPDIVFVDFDLGGSSGADFVTWIRHEAPWGRDVPAVATTAFAIDEVRRKCEDAGMDGFISKPVTPWKISETVARIERTRGGGIVEAREDQEGHSFIQLLSSGDAAQQADLLRRVCAELRRETAAILAHARVSRWAESSGAAHRMISIAVLLGEPATTAAAKALQVATRHHSRQEVHQAYLQLRPALLRHRARQVSGQRPDPAG